MGALRESVAARLTENLQARTEWDQPPQLYWISAEDGDVQLCPLPIPDGMFETGLRPADVVRFVADGLTRAAKDVRPTVPESLIGIAFYSEVWMARPQPDATEQERKQLMADGKAHRLRTRPDRIEARLLSAVDREGLRYYCLQTRGEAIDTKVEGRDGAMTMTGAVPDALDRILEALLGVTIPARVHPDLAGDSQAHERKAA